MIHLIVEENKEQRSYTYHKDTIIIGSGSECDIVINDSRVEPEHLRIQKKNDKYYVKNAANDPFLTINGLPFGSRPIKKSDRISLYHTHVLIDSIQEVDKSEKSNPNLTEKTTASHLKQNAVAKTNQDPSAERVVKQTMAHFSKLNNAQPNPQEENQPIKSLKNPIHPEQNENLDSILIHSAYWDNDEMEKNNLSENEETSPFLSNISEHFRKWQVSIILAITAIIIILSVAGGTYFRILETRKNDEKQILANISDISMALSYALFHQLEPIKQNWSSPEFLKNILKEILSPEISTSLSLTPQGQFESTPYLLRIYIEKDSKQFLLIAQPTTIGLFPWFLPKHSLIVDSREMKLRKINDLRTLNRLLANSQPFQGSNNDEILKIEQQGEIIPLSIFSNSKTHLLFNPSNNVKSEIDEPINRIYYAPRYSRFGNKLVDEILKLHDNQEDDIAELKQNIETLARLPSFILYTTKDQKTLREFQVAINQLFPQLDLLVAAYPNEEYHNEVTFWVSESYFNPLPEQSNEEISLIESPMEVTTPMTQNQSNELVEQLKKLNEIRTEELQHYLQSFIRSLNLYAKSPSEMSQQDLYESLEDYFEIDQIIQEEIQEQLLNLYMEHPEIKINEWMQAIEQNDLMDTFTDLVKEQQKETNRYQAKLEKLINQLMYQINQSKNLVQLQEIVYRTMDLLNLEVFPYPNKILRYENEIQVRTIDKIDSFLFEPSESQMQENIAFTKNDKELLIDILESIWMNDPEEINYYLSEFEQNISSTID